MLPKSTRWLIYMFAVVVAFLIGYDGLYTGNIHLAVFMPLVCGVINAVSESTGKHLGKYDYSSATHSVQTWDGTYTSHRQWTKVERDKFDKEHENDLSPTIGRAAFFAAASVSLGLSLTWFGLSFGAAIAAIVVMLGGFIIGYVIGSLSAAAISVWEE